METSKPQIEGVILDLDGTTTLGEAALPGIPEALAALRARGKQVLFVTNNPLKTPQQYAEKLTRLGIPVPPERILTSGLVLRTWLSENAPQQALYVVAEEAFKAELRAAGLNVLAEREADPTQVIDPAGIDAVVVAFDRTLDYRKLNTAYQALTAGARLYATNPDKACPMPGGAIPDAGATLAALEHLTGRRPDVLAGKPSSIMAGVALSRLSLPTQQCIMVGDRLETDVRMGLDAGMWAAVVLTGAATRQQAEALERPPHFILPSLAHLPDVIA